MSLKDRNGNWNTTNITLLCTVVVAFATCIMAAPTCIDYVEKFIAPWNSLPERLTRIERNQERVELKIDWVADAIGQRPDIFPSTNNTPVQKGAYQLQNGPSH